MEGFWVELLKNKVLWISLLSSLIAQSIKVILGIKKRRKFSFFWLLSTGGMPSAHSAAVVALTVCIGKQLGAASPFFAFSVIFAFITMFDAQTWRRSIGMQAGILNKMMEDLQEKKRIEDYRLKELVGHTPVEVFVGGLIGIIVPLIFLR
ncbi:MAG: divergent PAP2 family protein [Candidatus Omnitrophota bacterium]|nr:MAG: divergent PAP2 family protein [Candidatus Omnitrophota bacterium]